MVRRVLVSTIARRGYQTSRRLCAVKPFLLADIGEGIRECQIISWFVEPGTRVEQFDKICEVSSDKAASDITSPYDGIVKKLHYEADDMAIVGRPLLDIDVDEDETAPEDSVEQTQLRTEDVRPDAHPSMPSASGPPPPPSSPPLPPPPPDRHAALATPAVRHLSKQLDVDISKIQGTGKDGRVTKDDLHRHTRTLPGQSAITEVKALTPVQLAMFKTMTRSLTVPHFLYTSTVDMTALSSLRQRLNRDRNQDDRLSPLAFVLKAISLAFRQYPILNAALDTSNDNHPQLRYSSKHNFAIAVDTPSGLLVPVIRNVESQSVGAIASQVKAVSAKARQGKLAATDFQGATFTVSNIGSIGGGVVAPVIVQPQVAIVGLGRSKIVPAFDQEGRVVKREEAVLSWSADHRVVDGAECARCAELVRERLEDIETWVLDLS